jgi:hypothetical protein
VVKGYVSNGIPLSLRVYNFHDQWNWMIEKPIGTPENELQFIFRIHHQYNIDHDIIMF